MGKILISVLFSPWFFLLWLWRRKGVFLLGSFFALVVLLVVVVWLYHYFIVKHPGPEFSRSAILRSLSMETPVYYDDGKAPVGVFFENEHRIYIKYEDIPKDFVNALIAAEDKNFFKHRGIDPLSVARAAYVNFQAGKVIQGGSTLTQQTAKNLFKRSGRTFTTKWKELIQGLKLEARFSKEDIIEFFTNQFYVSGTGRGLAIAARYFFDKPVGQLNLLECAFIAGSVRAPNRYNPLVQPTAEKRQETLNRANQRKAYVLQNMVSLGMVSPAAYREMVKAPIPFKQGKVFHPLNVVMDYVRDELQTEKFQNIFEAHGISNIATSGIRIYTTINRGLQEASLRVVRKHLSRLETMLSGYDRDAIQARYAGSDIPEDIVPEVGKFVFGQVVDKEVDKPRLLVKVGDELGQADSEGLRTIVGAWKQFNNGMWAAPPSLGEMRQFVSQIEVGDLVYGYVRGRSEEDGLLQLELEQRPRLEGGLLISRKGKILAMVGGFENVNFNRAVDGRRQMGSIFKPLVYTAALQLGWNLLDPLENKRDVFVFQNQFYFPRPDHESPYDRVSLAWAGVKSENVASVWLLYHLCDKLSFSQFKTIAQLVDLTPRENETYYDFQDRVRDKRGILVNEDGLREAAYEEAKDELMTDLIFEGRTREAEAVNALHYGAGFDSYRETLSPDAGQGDREEDEATSRREYLLKQAILGRHFLRYETLNLQMLKDWELLQGAVPVAPEEGYQFFELARNFSVGFRDDKEAFAYGEDSGPRGFAPLTPEQALKLFGTNQNAPLSSPLSREDILIEGEVSSTVIRRLAEATEKELEGLKKQPPYSMASLWKNRDYRVLVGLFYVNTLCRNMGMETPLESVLSFPLGPNAVTLLDILQTYTTLTAGKYYNADGSSSHKNAVVIDRITDAEGVELYRYVPTEEEILDPRVVAMIQEVLKNVVHYGTGNKAQDAIKLSVDLGVRGGPLTVTVPSLGKTGTANEYSNSSYIGFVPSFLGGTDIAVNNSFVVGMYVGYDDNAPMKNNHLRIFGASGALPLWIDVANELVQNPLYEQDIDPIDFAFLPDNALRLAAPPLDLIAVPVDPGSGMASTLIGGLEGEEPVATLYSYGEEEGKVFKSRRFFAPLPHP